MMMIDAAAVMEIDFMALTFQSRYHASIQWTSFFLLGFFFLREKFLPPTPRLRLGSVRARSEEREQKSVGRKEKENEK
jgi:hypothetical protein